MDRYVGGVAGGIAEALDVDPIVVRLGLVVGTLYLPVLVVAYALAWLALPDERTGATLLGDVRRPDGWRPVVGIAALAIGVAFLAPDLGPGGDDGLTVGVLLAGAGVLLVLRHPGDAGPGDRGAVAGSPPASAWPEPSGEPLKAGRPDLPDPSERAAGNWPDPDGEPGPDLVPPVGHDPLGLRRRIAPAGRAVQQRVVRRRERPPSHLGWLGLSGLLVLAAVLAAVDRGAVPVGPGVAVSLALVLVGGVLLVAAKRGRARVLILPGLVLLPLWVGFGLSAVPRFDHDGDVAYRVTSASRLRRSYEHGYGQMEVDMRSVALRAGEHRTIRLGLTAGRARLRVPSAAHLVIRGDVGLGSVEVHEDPFFGRTDDSGTVIGDDVDMRIGDAQPTCTQQLVYGPDRVDAQGNWVPPEVVGKEYRNPWYERCEPAPTVKDPPVIEVVLDVGMGVVEVHREAA